MIEPCQFMEIAETCGLSSGDIPALEAAVQFSHRALVTAREAARSTPLDPPHALCALALGSVGRMEASAASDLDLAVVFDPTKTTRARAEVMREALVTELAAHFDIPQKTFRAAIDLHDLLRNVGGQRDTNLRLTYRALILTEAA